MSTGEIQNKRQLIIRYKVNNPEMKAMNKEYSKNLRRSTENNEVDKYLPRWILVMEKLVREVVLQWLKGLLKNVEE